MSRRPNLQPPSIARHLCLRWSSAIAVCWLAISPAFAQEIGKLYATRPPPGSAFIRVASIGDIKADTRLHINARDLSIVDNDAASRYRAVRADAPVRLSIDGAAVGKNITFLPDRFYTVVVAREGANWSAHAIDEGPGGNASDLKAQLRFFNLMPGCEATLRIAEGPTVFDAVAFTTVKSRAINPVEALLEATCGSSNVSLKLPPLRSGDHYSLFLTQAGGKSVLSGQFDETEPYRDR
ncbi:alginate O-acetyltransferase AlgF [Bradyrhizobium lablabi]|uniref:alginate O-acetyltransferase AlgF n=1 Tax=Bradyrhizobium lablabi TaxID=722472 RepID=UPI000B22E1BF|nr:alginate O-acetyltransferase AlgF [Bradyrhizobium lablabi]